MFSPTTFNVICSFVRRREEACIATLLRPLTCIGASPREKVGGFVIYLLCFAFSSPGLDHLLYSGRGAGGRSDGGEAAELHIACFMGLLSFLASRSEVLRVAPRQSQGLLNAAARANIQSATVTDTPLTDAGLDGTGQVVQVSPCNKYRSAASGVGSVGKSVCTSHSRSPKPEVRILHPAFHHSTDYPTGVRKSSPIRALKKVTHTFTPSSDRPSREPAGLEP